VQAPPPAYRGPDRDDYRRAIHREEYRRAPEREPEPARRAGGLAVSELDVPEYMPRGR
jgi:hypothetical protein